MLRDFYLALAPVSFTLLGLWLLVVQTRHAEWRHSRAHRLRAYAVWLLFALPGLMALLSLVDPASEALWRVSFAIIASVGVGALLYLRRWAGTVQGNITFIVVIALYALVALIAIAPGPINDADSSINALRAEAILLSLLIFAGVNVAWLMLFEEVPSEESDST